MRGFVTFLLVLLAAVLLTGMGGLGGPAGTVPDTETDIRARVFDHSGTVTELSRFSMNGEVFLAARRGRAEVTVFFRDLRGIEFGKLTGDNVSVELQMKSGETVSLEVGKRALFYGKTDYGTYQVRARDVRRIIFP